MRPKCIELFIIIHFFFLRQRTGCKFSYFIASHDAVHSIKRYLIYSNKSSSLVLAWVSVEYSGARDNCVCIVLSFFFFELHLACSAVQSSA